MSNFNGEAFQSTAFPETADLHTKFTFLSEGLAKFAAKLNIPLLPYRDPKLPHFSALPAEHKEIVTKSLEDIYHIYSSIEQESKDIADSKTVLWYTIKRLGLRPGSDLFATIKDTDIIEIHTPALQIFRNLNFFRLCSYSIEEVTSIHWTELFYRDQKYTDQIIACGANVFTKQQSVMTTAIEPHYTEELMSELKLNVHYNMKAMYPLFDTSNASKRYVLIQIEGQLADASLAKVNH